MRDRRTSSGSLGRLVRVLVAGPGEGETHFEDEIHDARDPLLSGVQVWEPA